MQFAMKTDYAIRTVLYLAVKDGEGHPIPSGEISENMKVSKQYLQKVIKGLKDAEIVGSCEGSGGGFYLRKRPKEIRLLEIIQTMESTTRLNRCLEEDRYCSRFAAESCSVRKCYIAIQKEMEDKLSNMTVEDLL